MSIGVDALFLVALCGTAGWLLQRRQQRAALPPVRPAEDALAAELSALRTGAVISQGPGGEDFVVTQVERLTSEAPLSLLVHLDAGGTGGRGLLVLPRNEPLAPPDARRGWLLRKLPQSAFWTNSAAEPPLHCDHEGIRYDLDMRMSDSSKAGAQARAAPVAVEDQRRLAAYRGPGERRLLLFWLGRSEHAYLGRELALASLDILPSAGD